MDHIINIECGTEETIEIESTIADEQVNRKRKRETEEDDLSDRPCPLIIKRRRLLKKVKRQLQDMKQQNDGERPTRETPSTSDPDQLRMYSQNIMALKFQVAELVGRAEQGRAEQSWKDKHLIETIQTKICQMEKSEVSFHQTKKQLEEQKTEHLQDQLKHELEAALQEQKIMQQLLDSRENLQQLLQEKNKELENEKEKAERQKTELTEVLENELLCAVCSEYLIQPCTLSCSHTFCSSCIARWQTTKNTCPICRTAIRTQTRCLVLDSLIDGMLEKLSPDVKARRQVVIDERRAAGF